MSVLQIEHLSKIYPLGVVALNEVNLDVDSGERLVLLGPSGAGKSTLLRIIAGLETATSGRVLCEGQDLSQLKPHERGLGILTQHPALYPGLTVQQNLTLDRYSLKHGVVEILQLGSLLNRYPHELSGGERQRVALARLAVRQHRLWLLDEPFHGLDPALRAEFRHDLLLLNKELHVTMILVTHDSAEAWSWGRKVAVLADGRLLEIGPPSQLAAEPQNLQTWKALQLGITVEGVVVGGEQGEFVSTCGTIRGPMPFGASLQDRSTYLTLGIRPEDVVLISSDDSSPFGREGFFQQNWPIILVEPVGRGWVLTLAQARTLVKAWTITHAPPPVGQSCSWLLPQSSAIWFDTNTGNRWIPPGIPRSHASF